MPSPFLEILVDAFTKQLADGRTAHVRPFITAYGAVTYTVVDDGGRSIASGWLQEAAERGVPEDRRPAGCTHLIAGAPALWFTSEEAGCLVELGDAAQAAFDSSPEGQALAAWRRNQRELEEAEAASTAVLRTPEGRELVEQRERLKEAAAAVAAADDAERERAYDSGEPDFYFRHQEPRNEANLARALEKLDAFDEQHPQIAEALRAEKDARTRRFLETD
ncbi:hypothetical protein ACGF12_13795 [Kitasatospora sp. NPDC048296]|uniref:hypothetical protein n=1 Tax=Kitasatospora sp. NPDC048296 TaxID=3364048 RepID=UPI003721B48E